MEPELQIIFETYISETKDLLIDLHLCHHKNLFSITMPILHWMTHLVWTKSKVDIQSTQGFFVFDKKGC